MASSFRSLEIQFPSAPQGKQGPFDAELLYEDPRRDLAFLRVASDLPAIEVAPSYAFTKGEDITVIGNPGLGDEVVLQNAISRGVMSSKTVIDGMNFLQLSMAINPGNSGGPVFDSAGRVIGVATLKSTKAEALAFCIPVDELNAALTRVGPARPDLVARHRAEVGLQAADRRGRDLMGSASTSAPDSCARQQPAAGQSTSCPTNRSRSSTRS